MITPSHTSSQHRGTSLARAVGVSLVATATIYLLTALHHAYGAFRYDTPWRLHLIPHGAVALLLAALLARWSVRSRQRWIIRAYAATSFVLFGVLIGWFEGGYNHVLKNLVYFAGGDREVLDNLFFFARNSYEIPNDWLFEGSGVLQFAAALVQGRLLQRVLQVANGSPQRAPAWGARPEIGQIIAPFSISSVHGDTITIPAPDRQFVHLHFRRFAGCPICITHLRELAGYSDKIVANGIRVLVFFHSSASEVWKHQRHLPFDVVADPRKEYYRRFGVGNSPWAVVHPTALLAALRSAVRGKGGFVVENGRLGLPADLLIDDVGRVVAAKWGAHAFDQWNAHDLLAAAAAVRNHGTNAPGTTPASANESSAHLPLDAA